MTVDIGVYAKRKPDFGGFLQEDIGLALHNEEPGYKIWRWYPVEERRENPVYIVENSRPTAYSIGYFDASEEIVQVRRSGIEPFIQHVDRNKGAVIADQELYRIFQQYPQLEELFPDVEPVWGLLKFTHGRPTYDVDLSTQIHAPQEVLGGMVNLARFFASRYNGIIWDEQTGKFGTPDAKEMYETSSRGFRAFMELMDKTGFDVRPAHEPESY